MFRVKICGVTRKADAHAAIDLGADAIGLNFYQKSKRRVAPAVAREIVESTDERALVIGVFVNAPEIEMTRLSNDLRLGAIQLHGDEPASSLTQLRPLRVVLARRIGDEGVECVSRELATLANNCLPDALLLDSAIAGAYGGSGHALSWDQVPHESKWRRGCRLILAGGLTPDNVAEAILAVRPDGVDVASGVESSPGVKDAAKVHDFVQAAFSAFSALT